MPTTSLRRTLRTSSRRRSGESSRRRDGLIASRGVITFISVGIASVLVARDRLFDPVLWSLTTAGPLLAHATNNLVNDFTDRRSGVDRDNYLEVAMPVIPKYGGKLLIADFEPHGG